MGHIGDTITSPFEYFELIIEAYDKTAGFSRYKIVQNFIPPMASVLMNFLKQSSPLLKPATIHFSILVFAVSTELYSLKMSVRQFCKSKPQIGVSVAIFWLIESWREGDVQKS
jgi:hypothetical protein